MVENLTALRWPGGKSIRSNSGTGKWIASQLPYRNLYVEPFAGMLGILLQRSPSKVEVVADTDELLINWWQVIRDKYGEFSDLLWASPIWSVELYNEAKEKIYTEQDPIRKAYWFTILVNQSYACNLTTPLTKFYKWDRNPPEFGSRIHKLAKRLRNVSLENSNAIEILNNIANNKNAVIYCDPPYEDVSHFKLYRHSNYSKDDLTEALLKQKGYVAVSGYGTEWDHLGWDRRELQTKKYINQVKTRVEVLWINE